MKIKGYTLRDGDNIVGNGFSPELTKMMIEGLLHSNIQIIEMGNAKGLGATEKGFPAPISDEAYLDLILPYLSQAKIGMFLNAKRFEENNVAMAADKGISFLRLGADAGDGEKSYDKITVIKKYGIKVRYSLMKAYLLTSEKPAEEADGLEAHGVDEVTIMDSAGTMHPDSAGDEASSITKGLISAPNVLITPHIGGSTADLADAMVREIVKDICDITSGRGSSHVVNREFLSR